MPDESKMQIIEVDMRGQVCPSTLLVAMDNLNKHREELQNGEIRLAIKTDNREATMTIPGTAESMGYAVQVKIMEGYYQIEICAAASADDRL